MQQKENRWYLLWFFTAAVWLITFCVNFSYGNLSDGLLVIQLLTAILAFVAGIVNRYRYKKNNRERDKDT